MLRAQLYALSSLLLLACGDDTGPGGSGGDGGGSTSSQAGGGGVGGQGAVGGAGGGVSTGGGGAEGCYDELPPADRDRFVVVGHPYDDATDPDGSYEVLRLSAAGALTSTGTRFFMGPPADHRIVFTPNGEVGFAVQDDGTIGVFSIDATGAVTVLDEGVSGDFYAGNVRWRGDGVWVVDGNFPKNGGGLYTLALSCGGVVTPGPRVLEAKSAQDLFFDEGTGDALLAARGALGSTEVAHVHRLDLAGPTLLASADAFGDDEAITSWVALTRGGGHLVLGDNSAFSAVPNRVAAVEITATGLGAVQVLPDIEDPYSIAVSPFDDAILVASGFGDALLAVDYDPASATPLSLRGELTYVGGPPQLPGALAMVERGALDGRVLIADVRGVTMVQFGPNAEVEHLGVVDLGGEVEDIVAGVGVQP
jgi:hypothetical protein